jgi:hypothetical protein
MPVHPLKGAKLVVVRVQCERLARSQRVIVEAPGEGAGHFVLPIEWTDRGPPWATPVVDGKEVRLSARGLLALVQAVDAALRQEVGPFVTASSASPEAERASKTAHGPSGHDGGLGGSDADDTARSARRMGKPGAQDAARKRGRR